MEVVLHVGLQGDRDGVGEGLKELRCMKGYQGSWDGVGRGTDGMALHVGLRVVRMG